MKKIDTKSVLQSFEETTKSYWDELENISNEQLKFKPGEDQWSLGQIMMHLIEFSLTVNMPNLQKCIYKCEDNKQVVVAGKTEFGETVFANGSYPPIQIKLPDELKYVPKQPEQPDEIFRGFKQVLVQMKEVEPILEQTSPNCTVYHPAFGELNAIEWFLSIDMHYRHHLLQLERLKVSWGNYKSG
ncbi:DinB superfamily protein [compost metagenome]